MSCIANKFGPEKKVRLVVLTSWLALLMQWPAFAVQTAVLSWNPRNDVTVAGYKIYYGPASRAYANVVDAGNATNVTVSGLEDGSTNFFAATTYDASTNESTFSDEVSFVAATPVPDVTNNPPPPPAPLALSTVANVVVATNDADAHSVILSWDASPDAGLTGYKIYCGTGSGNYSKAINVGLVTSLVVTGLVEGTTNYYSVRSVDAAWNESPMSSEVEWYLPVAANVPPTLNPLANLTVNMNTGLKVLALTGISCGSPTEKQTVKITAVSSNPKLINGLSVKYSNPNTNGSLIFNLVGNAAGNATITVTVKDNGTGNNAVTQTFNVTVVNTVLLAALPRISRQLTNCAALPGKTVSLGVAVSGRAPFKYQWKHNGTNLTGAVGPTLMLKGIKATQAGAYSVLVSNGVGATNSVTAQVTVYTNTAPAMSAPVQSNGQFAFQVTGVPGAKYVVQGSTDMQNWTSLRTNLAPFTFTDAQAASFNQRFYRSYYLP